MTQKVTPDALIPASCQGNTAKTLMLDNKQKNPGTFNIIEVIIIYHLPNSVGQVMKSRAAKLLKISCLSL